MYWKMNRLGFINFWKFKKEEFFFSDGCALIRGHNGSGKSIVIQSAVTFLFDGSMRKLDPSGTNARDMAFYVLGDTKKESTSYVYLEFINKGKYSTIGIGLKAKRNKGIDFWGFGLFDGRRIGEDISLYENGIPVTKSKLRSLISVSPDNFYTTKQGDYCEEVNRRFFGLDPFRYRELLSLLSEIRKPIAGADRKSGLSFIYDKLNNALPVLQDDDFESLASSLEMMDSYAENLDILKSRYRQVAALDDAYHDYKNAFILDMHSRYLELDKELEKKKRDLEKKNLDLANAINKKISAEDELLTAEASLRQFEGLDFSSGLVDVYSKKEHLENSIRDMSDKYDSLKSDHDCCQKICDELRYEISQLKDKTGMYSIDLHPSLSRDADRCRDLVGKLISIPDTDKIYAGMKDEIRSYIDTHPSLSLHESLGEINDIINDSSIDPALKHRRISCLVMDAFLKANDRYVERNAYIKAMDSFDLPDDKDYYDELTSNYELLLLLKDDLYGFPLLSQLFYSEIPDPGKKEMILRDLKPLYNKLFPDDYCYLENLDEAYIKVCKFSDDIRDLESATSELREKEEMYEKQFTLLDYYDSVCGEYAANLKKAEKELEVISTSFNDYDMEGFLTLRETVIAAKATVSNFNEFIIPDKRSAVLSAEEDCRAKEDELSKYLEYGDISGLDIPEMTDDEVSTSEYRLVELFMRSKDKLLSYQPELIRSGSLYSMVFSVNGVRMSSEELVSVLKSDVDEKEKLLSSEENEIYQKVLVDYLYEKLKHQIEESGRWVERIRELMKRLKTTSGKVFSIKWIKVREIDDFSQYFKDSLESYRSDPDINYLECVKECLDYRKWFEFRLDMNGIPLSNKRFLTLSGGERATAIYSVLLSALNSMYNECSVPEHPRLFALDEAFTVVDNKNIESVFSFIGSVGLDYLINSQTLWGTYSSVKSLSISHLTNYEDRDSVVVTRFKWTGSKRIPQFVGG